MTGDGNGEGREVMVCSTGGGGNWHVVMWTPTGWQTVAGGGGPRPAIPVTNQCLTGDWNGDGKTDMACWTTRARKRKRVKWSHSGRQKPPGGVGLGPLQLPVIDQCMTGD